MKHHTVIYFTANLLSDKILFLKLWVKMLMANQIENLLKRNISRKKGNRHQNFLQEDTIVLVWVARYAYNTQSNKVAKSWEERGET